MKNCQFLPTRRVEPEEVLAFFRDQCRHTLLSPVYSLRARDDSKVWPLGFHTTVGELRRSLTLPGQRPAYGRALNRFFGLALDKEEWDETLKTADKRTLRKLCNTIAARADWPTVEPYRICGKPSLAAGAFLTIRSIIARESHDVTGIRPSTRLDSLPREILFAAVRAVDFVAPGMLPDIGYVKKNIFRRHDKVSFGKFATFRDLTVGVVRDLRNRRSSRAISRGELLSVRAAKPEDILEIVQAEHLLFDRLTDSPTKTISPKITVSAWIRMCGLRDVFELEELLDKLFNLRLPRGHWAHILRPEAEKSVHSVCTEIAKLYRLPVIRPFSLLGRKSVAAGAYLALRSLLIESGVPVARLGPRMRISHLDREKLGSHWASAVSALLVLAPRLVDQIKIKPSFPRRLFERWPSATIAVGVIISAMASMLVSTVGRDNTEVIAGFYPAALDFLKLFFGIGIVVCIVTLPILMVIFDLARYFGIPDYRAAVRGAKNFRDIAGLLAEYGRVESSD